MNTPFRKYVISIAVILWAAALSAGPARAALVQYAVDSADDHDDGSCSAGDCTLREAILAANLDGQDSLILFNIPGPGPHVITVTSLLPPLTENGTTIDGMTQPGYGPGPAVVLAGDYTIPVPVGLEIWAGNCVVRGLSLIQFVGDWNGDTGAVFIKKGSGNIIEKNHIGIAPVAVDEQNTIGVRIGSNNQTVRNNVVSNNSLAIHVMEGVSLQTIQGNRIGTDPSGMTAMPNSFGIRVDENTSRVIIGGPGKGNLISGNAAGAISAVGTGHIFMGNLIGTDITGRAALPNHNGIDICGPADGFRIGGTGPGEGNVISGNLDIGLYIVGGRHVVQGNKIGVDVTGTHALGNQDGMYLGRCEIGVMQYEAHDILVGGVMGSGAENVISGNIAIGLYDYGPDNMIQGNFIGTDGSGSIAIPTMHGTGIGIAGNNILIGGTTPGLGNLISGNRVGVVIYDDDNWVVGNRIGTDRTGSVPLGNGIGVQIFGDNNFVGTGAPGAGNLISGNEVGVAVEEGNLNRVLGNRIGTDAGGTAAIPNQVGVAIGLDYDVEPTATIIGATGAGNWIERNDQCGILVVEDVYGVEIIENTIGNNGSAPGGLCAGQGIAVVGTYLDTSRVQIRHNSIFDNGGLGIELIGSMANDSVDPPILTSADTALVQGTACPNCRVEIFLVDPDPTNFGEGKTFVALGMAGGNGLFSIPVTGVTTCDVLTATATDPLDNTSEFSENFGSRCLWIPYGVVWMEIPLLVIIGGICGFLIGRRRDWWKIPMAVAGGVLGGVLGILVLYLPFVRVSLPPKPAEAEFVPIPICSQFLDDSRSGPPDGAVFDVGMDVLLEVHPASIGANAQQRWRLVVFGPDGASAKLEFAGDLAIHLSELGLDPSMPGRYFWKVLGEQADPESGGWIPFCRERLGRSFSIQPDRIIPNPDFSRAVPEQPEEMTSSQPTARTGNIANCRSGPGTDYRVIATLPKDGIYPVDGRNPDGTWWWVGLPGGLWHCWVAGENVVVEGDPEGVAEVEPPPLGCWVDSGGVTTSGESKCVVPCPEGATPGGVCEP
jgi:CSLREA domain-containing protein